LIIKRNEIELIENKITPFILKKMCTCYGKTFYYADNFCSEQYALEILWYLAIHCLELEELNVSFLHMAFSEQFYRIFRCFIGTYFVNLTSFSIKGVSIPTLFLEAISNTNLKNLQFISIFSSPNEVNLSTMLENTTKLSSLALCVRLSVPTKIKLMQTIQKNTLSSLSINDCGLNKNELEKIFSVALECTKLKFLYISSPSQPKCEFPRNTTLEKLRLHEIPIQSQFFQFLKLSVLTELSLSHTDLSGFIQYIAEFLSYNKKVKVLVLNSCNLQDGHISVITNADEK